MRSKERKSEGLAVFVGPFNSDSERGVRGVQR